jgi:hypothetical protein
MDTTRAHFGRTNSSDLLERDVQAVHLTTEPFNGIHECLHNVGRKLKVIPTFDSYANERKSGQTEVKFGNVK